MKKRLFGTILAAALIVSQAVAVFAAGESKTGEMTLVGDSVGWYELKEASADVLPDLAASAPEVMAKIEAVNSGAETLQSVADLAPELADDLEGKVFAGAAERLEERELLELKRAYEARVAKRFPVPVQLRRRGTDRPADETAFLV